MMVCSTTSGAMTLRHDGLKRTWRRDRFRAGVATLMSRYCACCATAATAHDSDERGDILACAAARTRSSTSR
jgi:putative hemolysin